MQPQDPPLGASILGGIQDAPKTSNFESRWPKVPPRPPTWSHHAPPKPQLASNLNPPTTPKPLKNQWFLKVFGISTNMQHDANNQPNMLPQTPQHAPPNLQLGAKMAPRPPNIAPVGPQGPVLEDFGPQYDIYIYIYTYIYIFIYVNGGPGLNPLFC